MLCSDLVEFTDEEGYGKYLDLHECFERYINLKGVQVGIFHRSSEVNEGLITHFTNLNMKFTILSKCKVL